MKFFAWVDDGKKYGGDPKMCMVDAAATSAGAAAAQLAAQEKDAKVKPAAQDKKAPALRKLLTKEAAGVTASTTNLQVKCGEKLTAIFSTLCCGTVEMWDAVFNPDIEAESEASTLQPVCSGPPQTGGDDVSLVDEDLSSSVDEDLSSLDV